MKSPLDRQTEVQLFDLYHAGDKAAGDEIIQKHITLYLAT